MNNKDLANQPNEQVGRGVGWLVGWVASSARHHQGDGPTSSLGPVSMGKEQIAMVASSLKSGDAVSLKSGAAVSSVLDPKRNEEADVAKICETTSVWIGVQPASRLGPQHPQWQQ